MEELEQYYHLSECGWTKTLYGSHYSKFANCLISQNLPLANILKTYLKNESYGVIQLFGKSEQLPQMGSHTKHYITIWT